MKKAIFIILDNVLIKTLSGRKYSLHSEDWRFIIQTVDAIKNYHTQGYLICIISNQPELYATKEGSRTFRRKVELVLNTLQRDLKLNANDIHFHYCAEPESYNYLPNPGMIYDFAVDHNIIVTKSILIGDTFNDSAILANTGIRKFIDYTTLTCNL